jgi:adenylylsulfate kinase-like enzyme
MIYWFTGQPSHGKTILADLLKETLLPNAYRVDGDDLRDLFTNKDFSIKGRVMNVDAAQKISHYLHNQGHDVIVSLVSPYIDQREEFKQLIGNNLKEIYIHTSETRERDNFAVKGYQAPLENFIDIDTTEDAPEQSLQKIINQIT